MSVGEFTEPPFANSTTSQTETWPTLEFPARTYAGWLLRNHGGIGQMKYSDSTHRDPIIWSQLQDAFGGARTTVGLWASSVRKAAAQGMLRLKIARMQSALSRLTDYQLKQINLKRSEIGRHAEYLITYEYDGL